MRRMAGAMLGVAVALALGACSSGGGGGGGGTATCAPAGTSLSVAAKGFKFDTDCLAAPADTAFTIEFQNQDAGAPHNVAILDDQGTKPFTGAIVNGVKTVTYQVGALPAGTYTFHCDVHTTMNGAFVVK